MWVGVTFGVSLFHPLQVSTRIDLIYTILSEKANCSALATEKKNAQGDSCELSFIGGKMRAIARETDSQVALRNRSEEVAGGR